MVRDGPEFEEGDTLEAAVMRALDDDCAWKTLLGAPEVRFRDGCEERENKSRCEAPNRVEYHDGAIGFCDAASSCAVSDDDEITLRAGPGCDG